MVRPLLLWDCAPSLRMKELFSMALASRKEMVEAFPAGQSISASPCFLLLGLGGAIIKHQGTPLPFLEEPLQADKPQRPRDPSHQSRLGLRGEHIHTKWLLKSYLTSPRPIMVIVSR